MKVSMEALETAMADYIDPKSGTRRPLTGQALAELLGVQKQAVSTMFRKVRAGQHLSAARVGRLAAALRVTARSLRAGTEREEEVHHGGTEARRG